jgi:hypothetical protein
MDLKEIFCESADWIHPSKNGVNTVMNLKGSITTFKFNEQLSKLLKKDSVPLN